MRGIWVLYRNVIVKKLDSSMLIIEFRLEIKGGRVRKSRE